MLSASDTINDVKAELENDFAYFGYSNDANFVSRLELISEDVYRRYFLPRIGADNYSDIEAKDHVALTEYEENLYWAEVYTICVEMLKWTSAKNSQLQSNSDESLKVEGYQYSVKGSSGSAPGDFSLKSYKDKMFTYWKLAGYNILGLERTCTIFGDA